MPAPTVKNTVNIRNLKPTIQPKPVSIGNTNFYASGTPSPLSFADETSNNVKTTVISMPTIIKPASSSSLASRKASPIHVPSPSPLMLNEFKKPTIGPISNYKELDGTSDESFEDDPPSPPMPTIPAPVLVLDNEDYDDDEEVESYGIALYDFESDVTEDLSFKVSNQV